jgi:alpha-L-fucosidase 2
MHNHKSLFNMDISGGMPAVIIKMLMASKPGSIELLPALPKAWPEGKVTGLLARGGFEVDITWKAGKLTEAVLRSKVGNPCRLVYKERSVEFATEAGQTYRFNGTLGSRKKRESGSGFEPATSGL